MGFGTADVDAFVGPLDDMDKHVGIVLLVRRFAAVTLDVGHRTADDIPVALHRFGEFQEPTVVVGVMRFIDLVGDLNAANSKHPFPRSVENRCQLVGPVAFAFCFV